MRADPLGRDAVQIGTVRDEHAGKVVLETPLGGTRLMDMLEGEQLPRIC
jgi:hydrogenase expression/formation protein HypE